MLYLLIFIEIALGVPRLSLANTSTVLENGLQVYVHSIPNTDMVHVLLQYDVGDGDSQKSGMVHLIEHLMFETSENFQHQRYDILLEEVGGTSNAKTGLDYLSLTASVPVEGLERLLFLESDRMFRLCGGLKREDIENQVDVVIQEFLMEQIDPFYAMDSILPQVVYRDGPMGRSVLGDVFEIQFFQKDEICRFIDEKLTPQRAVLVLVGDVDQTVLDRVRYWFSTEEKSSATTEREQIYTMQTETKFWFEGSTDVLYALWPTVDRESGHVLDFELMLDVLVHSKTGWLNQERYTAEGWVEHNRFGGYFMLRLVGGSASEMYSFLLSRMRKIAQISNRSIVDAQMRQRGMYVRSFSYMDVRAKLLLQCLRRRGEADCVAQELQQRLALSKKDLISLQREWLSQEQGYFLFVSPDQPSFPKTISLGER
ncbi:MAG: insulinase family protein [Myxococcota bacterium]|nr:insulinase family protein [Myxococcota bacterium]